MTGTLGGADLAVSPRALTAKGTIDDQSIACKVGTGLAIVAATVTGPRPVGCAVWR